MGIFEKTPHAFSLIVEIWPYLAIYGGYGHAGYGPDQKKIKGQELNKLKTFIEVSINDHKILIENAELEQKLKNESIDVTLPHTEEITGKIHPISQTIFSITEIFGNLNYSVEAGPDIESDFNNFSALNIPNFVANIFDLSF